MAAETAAGELTVTKTVRFDAAHILTDHRGMCRNLHGHTYRVDVCVRGAADPRADMVIDFKELKRVCEETILSRFDHSFVYDENSEAESAIAGVIGRYGMRAVAIPFRSTSENLARLFFGELKPRLPGLLQVSVRETPDSCATYREDVRRPQ